MLLLTGILIAGLAGLTWRYLGEYTLLLMLTFPLIDAFIDHLRQRRQRLQKESGEHRP